MRNSTRGRFYNVVDLMTHLETEARGGKQGSLADYMARLDFVTLDELGYLPFSQSGGQLLFHLISRLYERTLILDHRRHQRRFRRMSHRLTYHCEINETRDES